MTLPRLSQLQPIRFPTPEQFLTPDQANDPRAELKTSEFAFPQVNKPLDPGTRGICSLTHGRRTFRFRTNPNQFTWTYSLNKRVDPTYGGRVVQLLGTKIDDFTVQADCGGGRWEYANALTLFLRDVMIDQRGGEPATFEYTTRGWKLKVYIVSIPFQDAVGEVLREFTIEMKVQEDVSGVMTKNSLSAELRRLSDGVGFKRSKYNDPLKNTGDSTAGDSTVPGQNTAVESLVNYIG